MSIEVTTAPEVEPLTTAEARAHLRQDLTVDDDLIDGAIIAARAYAENYLHRALINQSITITRTGFGGSTLRLPVAPIQSITTVKYKDSDGNLQTWAASNYQLVKSTLPNRIAPAYAVTWPTTIADFDSVEVVVIAGYGDDSADIPRDILQAIKLLVAHFYENRAEENVGQVQVSRLSMGAHALLRPHVLHV